MKSSDLFVRCLEKEGVEYIFAVPGEENLDLLESLRQSTIKVIINRHEQAAAFMAATYGRLTGKVGVCMATLGPGATNLVTGIAYAQLGGMPLLAITGQKGIRENWQANFQVIDVVKMMAPITKHSVQIQGPASIAKEIRKAFKLSATERLGACHIELPEDIASESCPDQFSRPQQAIAVRRPVAALKTIGIGADLIRSAKHPIIIVSSRAQRNMVRQALRKFCDKTNIFVIHTQLGKGVLGDDHKNSLYAFGIHKKDYVNCVVDRSDLIITLGYATVEHPPSVWNQSMDKKMLHIDFTPADPEVYYNPTWEIVGDIASNLDLLAAELHDYKYSHPALLTTQAELRERLFIEHSQDNSFPLKPRRIVSDCRQALGKNDIICMDNGIYKMWFSRHYAAYNIGTFIIDNTLATMGAGLPSAMAAKLVHPEKRVLAVCGDGGFMMNSQELETAVRLKLAVVVLLVNDNAYGFIKWKQQNYKFTDFGLDLENPDFVKYAESYHAKGYRIQSADDLKPTLEQAFADNCPVLIECPIDYSENHQVWNQELAAITCNI